MNDNESKNVHFLVLKTLLLKTKNKWTHPIFLDN